MKRQTVITKKRRGPPPTGKGTLIGVRMQPDELSTLDEWIGDRYPELTRPEAIRRLVELGLAVRGKLKQGPPARAERAKELASNTIEHLTAAAPESDEKSRRKHRLIKGPEEFREVRVDGPKPEKS